MIRTIPKIALLIGALAVAGQASAHGGGGWGGPALLGAVVGATIVGTAMSSPSRTVYVQQQPTYYAPPPVYYQPQPIYVQAPPPPVYYQGYYRQPAPVYYGPPRGYYGPPRAYYGPPRW